MFKATTTAGVTVRLAVPVTDPAVALIVDVPTALATASPPGLTLAIADPDEFHVVVVVKFWVLPLLYVPVAVNCCAVPTGIEALAGVTAIDTSTAAVTVSVLEPVILPIIALMLDVLVATPVARPAAVIVATAGADEFHAAVLVRFCVLPSL
jgi:hypothetical protein